MASARERRTCTAPDCAQAAVAHGLCPRHYQGQYRRRGDPCEQCQAPRFAKGLCVRHYQAAYRRRGERCRRRGCETNAFSRGLCIRHYHRWYQRQLAAFQVEGLKDIPERQRVTRRRP